MRPLAAAALAIALTAGGCTASPAGLTKGPVAAGSGVTVKAAPVALNPDAPTQDRVGDFAYAGGLVLTADDTSRLHGLSDLSISADGQLTAVSDEGDLVQARIILGADGRLTGVAAARISALPNLDGKPLPSKAEGDAEGLAVMGDGARLVSFERHHRIWLYPADRGLPRPAPSPGAKFPDNDGMEALSPDPDAGPDAYVVGAEDTGETWTCRLTTTCTQGPTIAKPDGFGLASLTRLPQGRTAYVLRAWDPARGSRITLTIRDASGEVARLELAKPLTVDNFEGVAAVPGADGRVRFYLISDDNFSASQRTLLLAFDWTPRP